jgi:hypothetical protein
MRGIVEAWPHNRGVDSSSETYVVDELRGFGIHEAEDWF